MSKLYQLALMGQSIWYDNISRAMLDSGAIQNLIDSGVRGITSNPSIFDKAISGGDYDDAIERLAGQGFNAEAIYEALVIEDIGRAADMLLPVYAESEGTDGYVSLEVSPDLAHDSRATVDEARRLFGNLQRPNVMIKVPATPAGIPAIQTLIAEGININVTLIFALSHYEAVAQAYISGLEQLCQRKGDPGRVASVASFFVSRIDTAVDKALSAINHTELLGKIAIASAKAAYARFQEIYATQQWQTLARQGARPQRLLWASTGTKNPAYPQTSYVDGLIGADTVNTMPPATLEAFMQNGTVGVTLNSGVEQAMQQLEQLAATGIDLAAVTQTLQTEGVAAFAASFDALMAGVRRKRKKYKAVN